MADIAKTMGSFFYRARLKPENTGRTGHTSGPSETGAARLSGISTYRLNTAIWGFARALLLVGLAYVILFPLLKMLVDSFNTYGPDDRMTMYIPREVGLFNYVLASRMLRYATALVNSVTLSSVSALLQCLSSALAGYGLARYKLRFKGLFLALLVLTIIVPANTIMIPLYMNYRFFTFSGALTLLSGFTGLPSDINLLNTQWTFWIPSAFGVGLRGGLFILIFMQFFKTLPKDLENAAKVDGSGHLRTFFYVMAPNVRPGFITVFLFSLVWHWNDYNFSSMFFTLDSARTLSMSLMTSRYAHIMFNLAGESVQYDFGKIISAACVMTMAPVLLVFIVAQRYFVESIDGSILKG